MKKTVKRDGTGKCIKLKDGTGKMKAAILFVCIMMTAVSLWGCSAQETGQQDGNQSANDDEQDTPSGEVGYPDEISYWVELKPNVAATRSSLSDVGVYQALEEITGTQVHFEHPSGDGDQITEQLNLILASGDLPDVIETDWANIPRGPDNAIQEGTIIRLNELIDEHAPNIRQYLDENPDFETMMTTDEGHLYMFPFIRGDEFLNVFFGPVVRQDWLDQLEMEHPTTIDEWEEMLIAFRDQDLNGSGDPNDEIPLLLETDFVKMSHGFVGAWGIAAEWYHEDGEVKYGSIQPEFKEFLVKMNEWYEMGLIDPDFAAIDDTLRDAKVTGDQLGSWLHYTGSGIGKYMGLMDGEFQLVGVPYPTLNAGEVPELGQVDLPIEGWGAAITGSVENPEEIVKWLDFGYGEEGHMLFNFGIEGESYEMIDGYPTYTDYIFNNSEGLPPTQTMGQFMRSSYNGPFVQDRRYMEQYAELPEQIKAIETWSEPVNDKRMPLLTLTAEENSTYASIMSDVGTYWEEMVARFIMGDNSIDEFDDFVETLKAMGIEEAIAIQQAAMDRYMER